MVIGHANIGDKGFNSEMVEHFDCGNDQNIEIDGKELNKEAQKFYGFLKKTNEVLFEGSKKHSKLSFILDLFHKKCLNGWSNKSFKDLLGTLRETLLNGEKLPKSSYEVKKLIGELGLGYDKIHACHNNCMLFLKQNVNDQICSICGASRWVTNAMDFDVGSSTMMRKKKKKAKKVLRWFPLKPRLQRLFMCSKTASLMRWHSDVRNDDGLESPGDKIDVFMQHLIDELNDLWTNGLDTYDAHGHNKFQMRVALMWTINDFPACGMLSGWNTKSKFACPSCGFDTCSKWLDKGGKYCFMGHHRFLPPNHPFRHDKRNFDGKDEWRKTPIRTTGSIGLKQLDGKVVIKNANGEVVKKEENVCDNILGTLLNLDGKTKDNLMARQDLMNMRIRKELHPVELDNGKTYLPPACYSMSLMEKDHVLKVLKELKVPDSYSSNISRCDLLPIALRGTLPKKLEKIFPPSFFTIMVHLVIHLATEARLAGPVHYRWMYPIERYLFILKSNVRNRAHPEGSIAEWYIANESITYYSRYFGGVETNFNQSLRNDDEIDLPPPQNAPLLIVPGRPIGKVFDAILDDQTRMQAHRYVLYNCDSITPFIEYALKTLICLFIFDL
ncbi:uncharacterized protein LOC131172125 [Hevea brasiliensis]|uniref:uncharacterized protein LOC131172125 n=1 Tax=Hevea brasiliensis TaxID=3981 RepID=UPI0025EAE607|nr:uncharacterized protein LOC131172125 [Hevea brasiliensis]